MDKNNKLIIDKTSSLKGCNIRIRGENNFVEFKENTSFRNTKIEVRGRKILRILPRQNDLVNDN